MNGLLIDGRVWLVAERWEETRRESRVEELSPQKLFKTHFIGFKQERIQSNKTHHSYIQRLKIMILLSHFNNK